MSEIVVDQFQAEIKWLSSAHVRAGHRYLFIFSSAIESGVDRAWGIINHVTQIRHGPKTIDNDGILTLDEALVISVSLLTPLRASSMYVLNGVEFSVVADANSLILAKGSIQVVACRDINILWQNLTVDKDARSRQKSQSPCCFWFTGLSGAGKSTLANLLEQRLFDLGRHTYLLDGDNLRHGLNRDLGFTEADRVENIRRVAEVAKLMVDAGLIVIASFISPFRAERQMARQLFASNEFIEVYVATPLAECEKRDTKGLYAKARRGELKNFTGIDSAYEAPEQPEIVVDTCELSAEACVEKILAALQYN